MVKKRAFYDTPEALEQYLFFHYGKPGEYLPWPGPRDALAYPVRVVKELLDHKRLPRNARALDLGCAVGRSSFELTRWCGEVVGLDLSGPFIRAAKRIQRDGSIPFSYVIEGANRKRTSLHIPRGVHPDRVRFAKGDAMNLPARLGMFDVALLINLVDRVSDPAACLKSLAMRLRPGAQLIIASPYTWMASCAPRNRWLGGQRGVSSLEALRALLTPDFRPLITRQIPFLLREHARKYQWSMAEGSTWLKV